MSAAAATVVPDVPFVDPRTGKSPAMQMREALERSRRRDVPFDEAWDAAMGRVLWPHLTATRKAWRGILEGQRGTWRRAYDGEAAPKSLTAMRYVTLS